MPITEAAKAHLAKLAEQGATAKSQAKTTNKVVSAVKKVTKKVTKPSGDSTEQGE